jgi:hypothetical protein
MGKARGERAFLFLCARWVVSAAAGQRDLRLLMLSIAYFISGSTNGDVIASTILKNMVTGIKTRLIMAIPIFSNTPWMLRLSEKMEKQRHNTGQATMNEQITMMVKRLEESADSGIQVSPLSGYWQHLMS